MTAVIAKSKKLDCFLLLAMGTMLLVSPLAISANGIKIANKQKQDEKVEKNASKNSKSSPTEVGSKQSSDSTFDEAQSKAYVLVMDGKYDDAKKTVEDALKTEQSSDQKSSLYYLLSAINRMTDDYPAAIRNLHEVLKAEDLTKNKNNNRRQALLLKRLADCYWGTRNSKSALVHYNVALQMCATLPPDDPLPPLILESLTGTYVYDKDFKNAESVGKRLIASTTEHAKTNDLDDLAALFWAKLQMLNIYRNTGNEAERKALFENTLVMLDQFLTLRAKLESVGGTIELENMKQLFEQKYINEFHPESPAEYLWLASEFRMRSLPLIHWSAKNGLPKAAILCIHGLGLENRAFAEFGKEMQERGYTTYAMDVRGFGSWQTAQGQEDVQFDETIKDIRAMLTIISVREKNVPIFLLGESMGGAIALRGAAAYGNLIAGVISSVPSAERFQQRRMGFSVAKHLLQGKNRPFRVGDMVTEQATSNQALSDRWQKDFKAKMEMTPKELIKFAVFMRTTKKECEQIKTTPVFVVQGLKDRLVKPQGTIELFEAVPGEDKNLLIIGTAEHLMFETFKPSPLLMNSLTTWMDDHSTPKQPKAKNDPSSSSADTNQVTKPTN